MYCGIDWSERHHDIAVVDEHGRLVAAFAALADPVNRAYYDRKRAQGKKHNAVLICLARRRCDVLFAMLRDKIPYQPRPLPALASAA